MALALASTGVPDDRTLLACTLALLVYTTYRTIRPLHFGDKFRGLLRVLAEVGGTVLIVVATGYWDSPLAFSVVTAVVIAGFARGFGFALRVAGAAVLAVSVPWSFETTYSPESREVVVQWAVVVLLAALVAGYAQRILGEADERQVLAMDRLGRLTDANSLLYQLHQVTQTLPASLDLDEVLDTTVAQLQELFHYDSAAILLLDDTDQRWHTLRREGGRLPVSLATDELPPPLARVVQLRSVVSEQNLLAGGGPGMAPSATSGVYAMLPARGSVIGLLCVEHSEAHHFSSRDAELLAGFVEAAALALDNARWFGRLRTVGADEERTRIARDLHDRIGQSLAYLAFELDRIVKHGGAGVDTRPALDQLRGDLRSVIREVRDTLYDLRTDVTEARSLPATLEAFLDRVRERSGLEVHLRSQETGRLPILQERELWRIAQEAITNVERHARAAHLTVSWRCDGAEAHLEVADDGEGFPVGRTGRLDSYGLLGMRERAASIGATLQVDSEVSRGTRVTCSVVPR